MCQVKCYEFLSNETVEREAALAAQQTRESTELVRALLNAQEAEHGAEGTGCPL